MNMPGESSQQPTRETATGGASRAVLEYGWASPQITDPMFMGDGTMKSLKLTVTVLPAPSFDRPIAEAVPVPKMGVPSNCELQQHFLDPNVPNKVAK
jgi:hypothetical protein